MFILQTENRCGFLSLDKNISASFSFWKHWICVREVSFVWSLSYVLFSQTIGSNDDDVEPEFHWSQGMCRANSTLKINKRLTRDAGNSIKSFPFLPLYFLFWKEKGTSFARDFLSRLSY
jgi:hypothetical protein